MVRWLGETKRKVKKLILVSPGKAGREIRSTLSQMYGKETIKDIQKYVKNPIIIFTSNDDIPQHIEAAYEYEKELPAKVILLKGHGHFTERDMGTKEFPELLGAILE